MTEKRFVMYGNTVYEMINNNKVELLPTDCFCLLNELNNENEQLRKDLIDHSALILMLEDYQALKIEDTLYNLTSAESEEEFNELYKPYLDKAKKYWKGDVK